MPDPLTIFFIRISISEPRLDIPAAKAEDISSLSLSFNSSKNDGFPACNIRIGDLVAIFSKYSLPNKLLSLAKSDPMRGTCTVLPLVCTRISVVQSN